MLICAPTFFLKAPNRPPPKKVFLAFSLRSNFDLSKTNLIFSASFIIIPFLRLDLPSDGWLPAFRILRFLNPYPARHSVLVSAHLITFGDHDYDPIHPRLNAQRPWIRLLCAFLYHPSVSTSTGWGKDFRCLRTAHMRNHHCQHCAGLVFLGPWQINKAPHFLIWLNLIW